VRILLDPDSAHPQMLSASLETNALSLCCAELGLTTIPFDLLIVVFVFFLGILQEHATEGIDRKDVFFYQVPVPVYRTVHLLLPLSKKFCVYFLYNGYPKYVKFYKSDDFFYFVGR
jgi:hypothetical protein